MEVPNGNERASTATPIRFCLFIAGETSRSQRALENLDRIFKTSPETRFELEVIDVIASPERAEEERILATPTLIKDFPPPRRRVTGDLSDAAKVLSVLGPLGSAPQSGERS
jgi:circadian clock protein KaiB